VAKATAQDEIQV